MKFRLFVMLFVFVSLFNVVNAQILEVSFDKDFISSGDSVVIKIIANIDNTPILPRQLQVNFKGQDLFFRTCEQLTIDNTDSLTAAYIGSSRCSVTLSNIVKSEKDVEELIFTLFRPNGETVGTFNKNIYFDEYPPRIVSISEVKAGEVMTGLNLVLEDSACEDCDSDECSGLDKVEMRIGSNVFEGEFVNQTILDGSCSQTITLTAVGHDLINDLSVIVYDELGNAAKDIFFWNPIPIIRDVKVSGEYGYYDGNFGWLRGYSSDDLFAQKDLLSISALVRKGSSLVVGNEFKVIIEDQIQNTFFVCERLVNPIDSLLGFYNCTGQVNFNTGDVEQAQNLRAEVRMLKQTGEEFLDASGNYVYDAGNFKVDFTIPEISLVDDGFVKNSPNNYSIDVSASDEKGLLKFELYDGKSNLDTGNYFRIVELDGSEKIESTLDILNDVYFDYNGYKNIYIKVYDVVGHNAYTNVSLYFDNAMPDTKGGFKLFSSDDLSFATEYKYLSIAQTKNGHVYFEVKDESAVSVVSVDASRLTMNPIKSRDYKSFNTDQVSCVGTGSVKKCVFNTPVSVILDDVSGVYLNVTVEDDMGNKDYLIYEPEFKIDNDDPVPNKLSVGFCDEEFGCFVGNASKNPIVVEIKEPTSGFNINYCFERDDSSGSCDVSGKNIKVDVSEWLGSRIEHVLSGCINPNADTWVCRGYFEANENNFDENDTRMSRVTSVVDDAGNMYRDSNAIVSDSTGDVLSPVIISSEIKSLSHPVVADGDFVKVVSIIQDLSPVTMHIDISHILPTETNIIDVPCSHLEDNSSGRYWKCVWESDTKVVTPTTGDYAYQAHTLMNFTDIVGHSTFMWDESDVYLVDDSTGKRVGVTILEDDISPSYINRRLISVAPFIMNVPFTVNDETSSYEVVSMENLNCEILKNDTTESLYFAGSFDDLYLSPTTRYVSFSSGNVIAQANSKYRMKRILNENDRVNSIAWFNFSCDLYVHLTYETTEGAKFVFDDPDIVDFNWTIDLEDSLYEPGQKIMERLIELNQTVSNMSWLYPTITFIQTAQGICNLGQNLANIVYPLSDAAGLVQGTAALLEPFKAVPFIGTAQEAVSGFADTITGVSSDFRDAIDGFFSGLTYKTVQNGEVAEAGIISNVCNFINCVQCNNRGDNFIADLGSNAVENFLMETGDGALSMGGILDATPNAADWRSSFLVSVGCKCIPGILMKLEEHRQMTCRQMTCLRDKATMGLDISDCDVTYQQENCKFWMGELQQLGPMRVLDAYFGSAPDLNMAIQGAIAAPLEETCNAYKSADESADWSDIAKAGAWTLCELPAAFNTYNDAIERTIDFMSDPLGKMGDYFNNYINSWGGLKSSFQYSTDECAEWVEVPRLGIPQDVLDAKLLGGEE